MIDQQLNQRDVPQMARDVTEPRVASLCDATLGVLRGASLAVCAIGHGLAAARGLNSKHATKQGGPPAVQPEYQRR